MSDRDPLQQLAAFGTGGPVEPLPPAEVRRLGDRRRARRTAVSAVTGVVAVLAVVVPAGLYAAHDGDGRPVPPGSSSTARATTIPGDFPLTHGFGDDGQIVGPTSEDLGLTPLDLCGDIGWNDVAGTLATWHSTETLSEQRELALFRDERTAAEQVERFRTQIAQCRTQTFTDRSGNSSDVTHDPHTAAGLDDATGWIDVAGPDGPVGTTNVARVGTAVVLVSASQVVPGTGPDATAIADEATTWLAGAMCVFTDAGCAAPDAPTSGIPDDFPLDLESDYFQAEETVGPNRDAGLSDPHPCDKMGIASEKASDRLGLELHGVDFTDLREVRLFADTDTAAAVMRAIRSAIDSCPQSPNGDGLTRAYAQIEADTGYASYSFSDTVKPMGGAIYQYTRVGRAILTVVWSGEGTTPEGAQRDIGELSRITKAIAPELCRWSVDCADGPSPGASTSIPKGFPLTLDQHAMEGDGGAFTGPSATAARPFVEVCGAEVFTVPHAERLASSATGPEYADDRQLTTYASVAKAVAQMEAIRAAVDDCTGFTDDSGADLVYHQYRADTGYADSITFGSTYRAGPPGGEIVQALRVGRAILALSQYGEWMPQTQAAYVPHLTARTKAILPAMCAFTSAGC